MPIYGHIGIVLDVLIENITDKMLAIELFSLMQRRR